MSKTLQALESAMEARAKEIASDYLKDIASRYTSKAYDDYSKFNKNFRSKRLKRKWFLGLRQTIYNEIRKINEKTVEKE